MSIDHVQNDFQELKNKINHIDQIFEKVYYKTNKLKKTYSEFISRNKHLDSFGIDSLHFQSKLIECDNKHIENKYILICNKVYGEYYTLFKMISKFVNEHMDNKRIKDICGVAHKYPVYKKLEPYKKYTIDSIDDIHHVIIQTIIEMNNVLQIKENELKMDQKKSVKGLNIGNFVNRFKHENQYLDSQIKLYINYLDVFHDYHNKYLERVVGELKYLYSQMEQELTFDEDDDDEDSPVKQNDKTSYMNHVNTKSPQVNPNPNTNANPTPVPMANPSMNNNKSKRQSVRSKKNNNEPQPIIQMNVKEM
jgi:hypothetical protein